MKTGGMIPDSDIATYLAPESATILETMKRIDAAPYLFQLIVDGERRLLGTVTDGDIRRALLHGAALEDAAASIMQKAPLVGVAGDDAGNARKLADVGSSRSFLPLLDDSGAVVSIAVAGEAVGIGHALVMAGGYGRRLGTKTRVTPKPLLRVGGRPLLDIVLGNLEKAGVPTIHVAVHYLADQIADFVEKRRSTSKISLIVEDEPLGTAGAVGLVPGFDKPLLVVNGDLVTDLDYHALHEFHVRHGHDATVAVAEHETDVPFGVVRFDDQGLFSEIVEKPKVRNFVAAGIYYLDSSFAGLSGAAPQDMPALLTRGRRLGLKIGLFPIHEAWADIGRPADLEAARHRAEA